MNLFPSSSSNFNFVEHKKKSDHNEVINKIFIEFGAVVKMYAR